MLLWRESSPDWGLVTLIAGGDFRAVMVSGHSEALCVATLKSIREAAGLLSPAFLKEKKKSKSTMGFKLCRGDSYHLVRLKWGNAHILRF